MNQCWLCGEPGPIWGRCGIHSGGRNLAHLFHVTGFGTIPEDWPQVPPEGLGPDVAA